MKLIVLLTLFITIGCVLATGCIGQIKKDNGSGNVSISPTNTFSSIVNYTTVPVPSKSGINGTLVVSIGSWDDLPLFIDNTSAGIVTKDVPLILKLEEGNHTVQVCSGSVCETEVVEIKFAKQSTVDFSDQLKRDLVSPIPSARILQYSRNEGGLAVTVEFVNPSAKDLSMDTEVSVGYSYIDGRDQKFAETSRGIAYADVKAHQRKIYNLNIGFAYGYSYTYSTPTLGQTNVRLAYGI